VGAGIIEAGIDIMGGKPALVHVLGRVFEVETGAEGARHARQHRDLAPVVALEIGEDFEQRSGHLGIDGVACLRPVDRDDQGLAACLRADRHAAVPCSYSVESSSQRSSCTARRSASSDLSLASFVCLGRVALIERRIGEFASMDSIRLRVRSTSPSKVLDLLGERFQCCAPLRGLASAIRLRGLVGFAAVAPVALAAGDLAAVVRQSPS
jgi:hypothetical protein